MNILFTVGALFEAGCAVYATRLAGVQHDMSMKVLLAMFAMQALLGLIVCLQITLESRA